eukprot:scaffold3058_cov177-Amphora_coffeaeformis.AAC.14
MKTFIKESKKEADKAIKAGPEKVKAYQALLKELYPPSLTVSAVMAQYSDPTLITKNALIESSLSKTLDALNEMSEILAALEQYVTLNIPQMEDGNNFGVTVQMSAQQHLTQVQDDIAKDMEDLLKYKSNRADALEKCKLPSKATTVSTTLSESESKGKTTKDGDQESKDNKTSKESKTTETGQTESPDIVLRAEYVQAVDVAYYGRAKAALRYGLMGFMNVLNFFELNQEKIDKPKGTRGSSSMY